MVFLVVGGRKPGSVLVRGAHAAELFQVPLDLAPFEANGVVNLVVRQEALPHPVVDGAHALAEAARDFSLGDEVFRERVIRSGGRDVFWLCHEFSGGPSFRVTGLYYWRNGQKRGGGGKQKHLCRREFG